MIEANTIIEIEGKKYLVVSVTDEWETICSKPFHKEVYLVGIKEDNQGD